MLVAATVCATRGGAVSAAPSSSAVALPNEAPIITPEAAAGGGREVHGVTDVAGAAAIVPLPQPTHSCPVVLVGTHADASDREVSAKEAKVT